MNTDNFTIKEKMLPVNKTDQLYIQDWGNPNSRNLFIHLHGGPGSGTSESAKDFYDPKTSRVLFFDQRGSGKSTPHGNLEENETSFLIDDIEKISNEFNFKKFTLVGRSWGSCLALLYAIKYPEKVQNLVIGGIFLGSKSSADMFDKGYFKAFYPDVWESYQKTVPVDSIEDPTDYHFAKIDKKTDVKTNISPNIYANLADSLSSIKNETIDLNSKLNESVGALIEMWYMKNNCFLTDDFILKECDKITAKTWIVQGRYDMICPGESAYNIAKKIPSCELIWTIAGHSGGDQENLLTTKEIIKDICLA